MSHHSFLVKKYQEGTGPGGFQKERTLPLLNKYVLCYQKKKQIYIFQTKQVCFSFQVVSRVNHQISGSLVDRFYMPSDLFKR